MTKGEIIKAITGTLIEWCDSAIMGLFMGLGIAIAMKLFLNF